MQLSIWLKWSSHSLDLRQPCNHLRISVSFGKGPTTSHLGILCVKLQKRPPRQKHMLERPNHLVERKMGNLLVILALPDDLLSWFWNNRLFWPSSKSLNEITKFLHSKAATYLHSKSEKVCGFYFSVSKKSAEKVRKWRRQNFATNVRKSMKSLRNASFKN